MKPYSWRALDEDERQRLLARPAQRVDETVVSRVREIINDVERRGAAAARDWSMKLDHYEPRRIELSRKRLNEAKAAVEAKDLAALELAAEHVRLFHDRTRPADEKIEVRPGVVCERRWRPIPSCGLYAPGGSAPLFSTLLMLAEPARAAGVRSRIAVTPPARGGGVHPMMVLAAQLSGLEALHLIGGGQAIAALAFGAGVPKADKIFGPGNAYVAEAKRQIAWRGIAAIDLPAGPSELMVIADPAADADLVAADLLSQAEHDSDAQVMLVSTSSDKTARILDAVASQLKTLPRAAIAERALAASAVILVEDLEEAAMVADAYAPEHLALHVENAAHLSREINNAGAIFVGAASAEVFGDYVSGPSHVLPTDRAASAWSGVSTASFMKCVSVQTLSDDGAAALAGAAARLARLEGLEAHARAAEMRR